MACMIPVGIIGASGYTGAELLRICAQHPAFELRFATGDSQAGNELAEVYPSLAAAYGSTAYQEWSPGLADGVDVVFLGLPHGASQRIVPDLIGRVDVVVDLAADFRLRDPMLYPKWYGEEHRCPELLEQFVYGLPELGRDSLLGAGLIATPGCYPTAASLAMAPLLREGLVSGDPVIVDAVSGLSGAGRPPKPNTTFCAADGDVAAYGLLSHRHTPEMEINLGAPVLFTPHLVPMSRGILATCYGRVGRSGLQTADVLEFLAEFYRDEPFVVVSERSPSTKATLGTNAAHLTARVDERTGMVIAIGAIDNLGKGAAGAAVQCANIALGLPEASGLQLVGTYP
jgi:N-acetyl-gamma-glutamyl-phosphate reductase